jgi:tol-pal system protein YbgF
MTMMTQTHFGRIGARAAALLMLASLGSASPSSVLGADAKTGEQKALVTRIERLERDLRELQREYYSQTPAEAQESAAAAQSEIARLTQRVTALEESLRTLTGQVESLSYTVQQLQRGQAGGASGSSISGGLASPETQGIRASMPPSDASRDAADTQSAGAQVFAPTSTSAASAPQPGTLGTLRVPPGTSLPGDEKAQLDAAMNVLYRGDYAGGAQALQSFVEQNPKSPYVSEAQYWLGEANYTQKAYREAATAYLTVVTKYPKSDKAPQSMVKLGMSLIAAGQKKDGCTTLGQVREMFPKANPSVLNMARMERERSGCK